MIDRMDRWAVLAETAASQFGLIAVWQAGELGLSRQLVASRAAREGWTRVVHGVYALPAQQLTPLAQIKAVELALRNRGLASHRAAAFAWGLTKRLHRPVEFIVPPNCSLRVSGAHIRRQGKLLDGDATRRHGIWTTAPARTICLLAAVWSVTELASGIATAHRLRLLTPATLEHTVHASAWFAGRRRLCEAQEQLRREGLCHSSWERLGREVLRGAGLRPHPTPFVVEDDQGIVAELDIAFPKWRVGIPVDGPHHLQAAQKRADDDQRLRLQLLDWLLVPTDETRLRQQPQVFLRQVQSALEKQGWSKSFDQR